MFHFGFYKTSWLTFQCYRMVKSMHWSMLCTQVITETLGVYVVMYRILYSLIGRPVFFSCIWSSLTLSTVYHLMFLVSCNRFLSSFIYVFFWSNPFLFLTFPSHTPPPLLLLLHTPLAVGYWPHWSGGGWLDDSLVLKVGQDTRGDGWVWDVCVIREQLYKLLCFRAAACVFWVKTDEIEG